MTADTANLNEIKADIAKRIPEYVTIDASGAFVWAMTGHEIIHDVEWDWLVSGLIGEVVLVGNPKNWVEKYQIMKTENES